MRLSLRRVIILVGLICIISITILKVHPSIGLKELKLLLLDTERFDSISFKQHDLKIKKQLHYSNYLYSGYKQFINHFGEDIDQIKARPNDEKCNIIFDQFNTTNPDWKLTIYNSPSNRFDKSSDKKESFFKERINRLREKYEKNNPDAKDKFRLTRSQNHTILEEYNKHIEQSQTILQEMADSTTLLRLYGKCFFNKDLDSTQAQVYDEFTDKLFPFLTDKPPILDGDNSYNSDVYARNSIDYIYKNSKGKGIVVSAATRHSRDLVRLIKVLRALNNKLPIQIMHKGDITKKWLTAIEEAAVVDIETTFQAENLAEDNPILKDTNLLDQSKEFGSEFPKQDLTFVNLAPCIKRNFKYSFPGYSNKLLALLFSTFNEIILLDADTVPLVPPMEFFESKEYQKSGTYFFQDRSLRDNNDYIETNYFATLFPSNENSIDNLFDIPRITEKTLNNKYMTGWRHYQEAGVVAFNKKEHFTGLLMMFPLSLWQEPVKSSIWGDKELYWIGLSAAGDENYEFNPYSAASVGEATSIHERKFYPNSKSREVCSTHPGHVNGDGKLLWINSGFGYCKKNGYYRDRVKFPFTAFESNELVDLFNSPLKIRAALIPPDLPRFREPGQIDPEPELEFKSSWKLRKKDIDEINEDLPSGSERTEFITEWGPQKGWVKNNICFGYFYCAYDSIESYSADKETDNGKFYEFDEESVKFFDYLSKVWLTGVPKKK
ncbi:uncharacterized protein KGF55_000825 [Candida pseudojiufengensis]|uniref:uncharacterized protein n=1 Tax=Candida pseudojiufengensis TaxID=497109 RepID=UPI002224C36F|nr:uncharacterized protein KGF55_000825 [Candida pseudojiufengensis]KAI5966516.1 hypothetical protein KGF55_000825 [Candida pseudojiufengensis]